MALSPSNHFQFTAKVNLSQNVKILTRLVNKTKCLLLKQSKLFMLLIQNLVRWCLCVSATFSFSGLNPSLPLTPAWLHLLIRRQWGFFPRSALAVPPHHDVLVQMQLHLTSQRFNESTRVCAHGYEHRLEAMGRVKPS